MEVLGEASDRTEAVAMAREFHPDVVLMDVRMPGQDGIEATRQIKDDDTAGVVKVLILTTFDLDEYVYAALRAGASGFVLKDTTPGKAPGRDPGRRLGRGTAGPDRHPAPDRSLHRPSRRASVRRVRRPGNAHRP
jgi:chemotaxis response regulator CheB